ncbi:HD domain-containing protein [Candidatus Woesearchaeota archaeon]|nr:HD domain-containing protein [Candidatus Woesearchaeota archaeon]
MEEEDYKRCEEWFDNYVEHYRGRADPKASRMVELKIKHTKRTVENAKAICDGEGITGNRRLLALTATLLHDTGRFEQATKHRTFNDKDSTDHAALGTTILEEEKILAQFKPKEQDTIRQAVNHHNKKTIPPLDDEQDAITKAVRDADKLDIMDLLANNRKELHLEGGECTPTVVRKVMTGQLVSKEHVRTACDHALLTLNWLDHLNYATSRRIAKERRYAQLLLDKLPESPEKNRVRHRLTPHLQDKTL